MEFEEYADVIDAYERDNMGYDTLTDYIKGQNIKIKGISLEEAGTDSTFLGMDEPPTRRGSGIMETEDAQMMMTENPMQVGTDDDRDPFLVEEYEKYIFEMMEQGLQPMSFEEFRREAMSGMAKDQPKEIEEIKEKKVITLAQGGIASLMGA